MLWLFQAGGFNMWVLAVLGGALLWTAARFARGADPHRLSIVRALSIATGASACAGFASGVIAMSRVGDVPAPELGHHVLAGVGESAANLVLGAAVLAIAWTLIAVGVRRMPRDAG